MKRFLEAGKITSVHGIKGEVKIYPLCDSPEFLCKIKELYRDAKGKRPLGVTALRAHKNIVIAKISGCDTVERAREYLEETVYFDREEVSLDEGSCFIDDLLGLSVVDADTGKLYGTLSDVGTNTAQDIYFVKTPGGEIKLFPAVKQFVRSIDIANGRILVTPIKGMFDDED